MARESLLLELNTMSDEKPTVDDLLFRPRKYLREEYGQFGEDVTPAVLTHDRIVAVLATMDQQNTANTYDPNNELWEELQVARDRIKDDLQGAIEDEFDE